MNSNAWVPTAASLEALDLLRRAPFLRVADLALELKLTEAPLYALIRRFRRFGWVESVTRPGVAATGRSELYYVTPAGLEVLEQYVGNLPTNGLAGHASRTRLLLLLPRLDRLGMGYTLIRNLLTNAPDMLRVQGRTPLVRWTWLRDYQQSLPALDLPGYKDQARLFADWLIVLHVKRGTAPEEHYPLFVLLDHPCVPQQQIRHRLATLFHARHIARRAHPEQAFPLVLIMLSAEHRVRHWQRLATDLPRREEPPLRGCLAVAPLASQGKRFNLWRLPWQNLSRSGPRALPDLLVSWPISALPQGWRGPCSHCWGAWRAPDTMARATSGEVQQPEALRRLAARFARLSKLLKEEQRPTSVHTLGLLGLALERSHYRILELVGEFPLLTQEQMAALLSMQESSLRQYLGELRPFQCLETERFSGETQARWRLSPRGLHLLALRHHIQLRKLAEVTSALRGEPPHLEQKGVAVLRQHATLTAGIYAFFARLAADSTRHIGHQFLWWETAYAREHSYYALSRQAWRQEKPHGMGEYRAGSQRVRFWLEWHGGRWPGKEHLSHIFASYAAFIHSHEWRREGQVLPALLLVAPDGMRERHMQQIASDLLLTLRPAPLVLTTTIERCDEHGPLAAIWDLALSPIQEESQSRRPFYDLRIRKAVE
jgi:DNA-binding MarR family transcriptional regulator